MRERTVSALEEMGLPEKQRVALHSVLAALFLPGLKLGVGLWSGSLGILSEAANSGASRARRADWRFILGRRLNHNGREVISRDGSCCRIHSLLFQF